MAQDPPGTKPKNTPLAAAGEPAASPLLQAIQKQQLEAMVADLDHYRIGGGLAVETDYIISVVPKEEEAPEALVEEDTSSKPTAAEPILVESFLLCKTYSSFRTLAHQLKKVSDAYTKQQKKMKSLPSGGPSPALPAAQQKQQEQVVKYCDLVSHLIESQRTEYVGKVNYMYVKMLAKERSKIINEVLEATLAYCPLSQQSNSFSPFVNDVGHIIETFFLTDHIEGGDDDEDEVIDKKKLEKHHSRKGSSGSPIRNWLRVPGFNSNSEKNISQSSSGGEDKSVADKKKKVTVEASHKSSASSRASVVVPYTRRSRRPSGARAMEEEELNTAYGKDAGLLLDDARTQRELGPGAVSPRRLPSYSRPVPVVRLGNGIWPRLGRIVDNNPWLFVAIGAAIVVFLRRMATFSITLDADVALWVTFAAFCLGLHTPRPMIGGFDRPTTMKGTVRVSGTRALQQQDKSGRQLLRRSIIATTAGGTPRSSVVSGMGQISEELATAEEEAEAGKEMEEEEEVEIMDSPMAMFPKGAAIGSHNNCWSIPDHAIFHVRGSNYLEDKKKIPSGEFMFPCRGVDLFLTDTCPENCGAIPGVMGGRLREASTFIINFRLPWGVLLFYFEIPDRFLPFIRACYEDDFDQTQLPSLDDMTPSDRAVCRFMMGPDEHKNNTIKIVPYVVDGPWVVRSVVGGKPALIGKKLPVSYVYQPAEEDDKKNKKALYLEADLDIAASSAARGILSVARSYCQILTIDLGFVVQGNSDDELPEQMMVGARLHGIDPLTAPSLPPVPASWEISDAVSEDESV